MRIIYAKFSGYIGFYAKMGLEELEIDFSRSKSNIILIVGMNGSGKSTLLNALNIFPDPSSSFMNDRDAKKYLRILDNGNIYEINIISPFDGKGGRKTTKAFISLNGVELNPNGNVTSYKEIITDEFNMDPIYITLSMLTSIDRGLADKRPAERKKFVGSIIDNLAAYNNMYKVLNKKSLLYKSYINTIHTKIQSTGDKNVLESSLAQLKEQANSIRQKLMDINNAIVSIETKNSINNEDAEAIQELNNELKEKEDRLSELESIINGYHNKTKIAPSNVQEEYNHRTELLEFHKNKANTLQQSWMSKSNLLSQMVKNITQLEADIPKDIDDSLSKSYNNSINNLNKISKELSEYGFKPNTEFILHISDLLEKYDIFIRKLDSFYDGLNEYDIKYIINRADNKTFLKYKKDNDYILKKMESLKDSLSEVQDKMKKISVLDNRPSKCKIETCPFIKEAVDISKNDSKESLVDQFEALNKEIDELQCSYTENLKNIDFYQSMLPKRMELDAITEHNYTIEGIEKKIGIISKKNVYDSISRLDRYNDRRDPKKLKMILILLKQYDAEKKSNDILKAEFDAQKEKKKLIDTTINTINNMKEERDKLEKDIADLKFNLDSENNIVSTLNDKVDELYDYNNNIEKHDAILSEKQSIEDKLSIYQKKSSKILESIELVQSYKEEMNRLQTSLAPIDDQISDISGKLLLLSQYYNEYTAYNSNYQMIETLKKYCSPTGGGIQTFFMQLYMSKTLELANHILSMIFGGEYRLADFIVNEDEFRIPFIGSGMMVDDISSGSNSQIAMMGMVINLVLLHQASTKFNIAYLDEIDAGLDHRNRFEFVQTLRQAVPLLGIEQVFLISHSMEADTSSTDVIKLMTYDEFEDSIDAGNIIYDYNN